jgi:hypothetical protein
MCACKAGMSHLCFGPYTRSVSRPVTESRQRLGHIPCIYMDGFSLHWRSAPLGALLTTGWARSFGSAMILWVESPVNTTLRSATPFSTPIMRATNVEQLLWNQCNGRVCDTRTIARMRFGVLCPPVNWSGGRTDSFGDPNEQGHPVVNSAPPAHITSGRRIHRSQGTLTKPLTAVCGIPLLLLVAPG